MNYLRSRLSSYIACAMIPLALWAGMPSVGCICADGQHKLFCFHTSAEAYCCDHGGQHDHDCCAEGETCCVTTRTGHCTPVFSSPATKPVVATVTLDWQHAGVRLTDELPHFFSSTVFASVGGHDVGPPDLIVILGRRLI